MRRIYLILAAGAVLGGTGGSWFAYRAGMDAERTAARQRSMLAPVEQQTGQSEVAEATAQAELARAEGRRLAAEVAELRDQVARAQAIADARAAAVPVHFRAREDPEPVETEPELPRLKRVTAGGEQVELSDGSIWEPMGSEQSRASAWKLGVRLKVVHTGEAVWDYRLVNRSAGETVDVKLMTPAER